MLSLDILASKTCEALECWTENKGAYYLITTKANQENDPHSDAFCAACLVLRLFHVKVNLKFQSQIMQFVNSEKTSTVVGDFS